MLWGSRSVLCVSVFQGSLLLKFSVRSHVFEKHTLAVVFCLLYTETWQVEIPKVKLFLYNPDPELFCACTGEGSRALGNPGARLSLIGFSKKQ